ncbi:MAG: V-type ATP synthase subunit I [Clostridiales bacterium]|jgi:V/A-type H+-transporting ATPase subunit I|nr:V-type ATP synthase subunit I [Clostridiales bacterium]
MSIVKMKKIVLTAVRSQKDELLRELMLLGCLELAEPEALLSDPRVAMIARPESSELEKYRDYSARITQALNIIRQYAPYKTSLFSSRPEVPVAEFLREDALSDCLGLADRLIEYDSRLKRLAVLETRENSVIESLLPWENMDIPLNSAGTRTTGFVFGAIPPSTDMAELDRALEEAVPEAQIFEISRDNEQLCISAVYLREKESAFYEFLRTVNFSASSLRTLSGVPRDNIARVKRHLEEISAESESIREKIINECQRRFDLQRASDYLETKIARAAAGEKLVATSSTVTLVGWIPASSENKLSEVMDRFTCAWELSEPAPEEYENVPVQLKNNALTSPLSMVTEMYSLPAYDGVDPNPLIAPFFVLFYGIMMSDVGYGLIMVLAALIVKRKKPRGSAKNFFNLLLMCGISTMVLGFATGSFFGDALQQIAGLLGGEFVLPYTPLLNPIADTQLILIGALALGGIQIIVGMAISFIKQTIDGHFPDAVFDVGSWWLLFAGIAVGALGGSWWVAAAGAAALVLTQGRSKPTIIGKFISGLASLYNITGYFGDILSYSRLMALMLAGGVIAQVFNTIAALTGSIVFFIPIFLVGHAMNLGLNLLGCYVHDLRLQCLEYFGKFYKDGGRPFNPLSINTKYVDVVCKDQ